MTHEEAIRLYQDISGVVGVTPIPEVVKNDIRRLYRSVTGITLRRCNCPDLYTDALIEIRLKLKNMKERKYKLKRGVVIQIAGTSEVYTRDNITDEVAKSYLEKYPHKSKIFEAIPAEDADEKEVTAEDAKTETEVQKPINKKKRKK